MPTKIMFSLPNDCGADVGMVPLVTDTKVDIVMKHTAHLLGGTPQ